MIKINSLLGFNVEAEEATNFYVSVFKNSKILNISRYGDAGPGPNGQVMMTVFELAGEKFMALNMGSIITSPSTTSFFVECDTQEEVDYLWEGLSAGGEKGQCGWLKDKFGVSWNIVPTILGELMNNPDPVKSQKVFKAMLGMTKLDIKELKKAAEEI